MPELEGQLSLLEGVKDELGGEPTASRALKLLDYAFQRGWVENPHASFVVRLTRDDGLPFYFRYDLAYDPATRKRSGKFAGAMAQNGQKLNYNDIRTYLDDPRVIQPEMPDELCEAAEHDNPENTFRDALGALRVISKPDPAYIDGPPGRVIPATDWGALFS